MSKISDVEGKLWGAYKKIRGAFFKYTQSIKDANGVKDKEKEKKKLEDVIEILDDIREKINAARKRAKNR